MQRFVYVPPRRKTRTRRYGSSLYKRYVEHTLTRLPKTDAAAAADAATAAVAAAAKSVTILNGLHPNL